MVPGSPSDRTLDELMSSFDPATWSPGHDSSPEYADRADSEGIVFIDVSHEACLCGCRGATESRFVPGHDARLKGKLIRAHLMETPVWWSRDSRSITPLELASRFGWREWLEKAEQRRWKKCLELAGRAEDAPDDVVKAGIWDKTGMPFVIFRTKKPQWWRMEYVDRAGKSKRMKLEAEHD